MKGPDAAQRALQRARQTHEISRQGQIDQLARSARRDQSVHAAREAGVSVEELASELGVAPQRIYAFAAKGARITGSNPG